MTDASIDTWSHSLAFAWEKSKSPMNNFCFFKTQWGSAEERLERITVRLIFRAAGSTQSLQLTTKKSIPALFFWVLGKRRARTAHMCHHFLIREQFCSTELQFWGFCCASNTTWEDLALKLFFHKVCILISNKALNSLHGTDAHLLTARLLKGYVLHIWDTSVNIYVLIWKPILIIYKILDHKS